MSKTRDELDGLSLPEIQAKFESMQKVTSVVTSAPKERELEADANGECDFPTGDKGEFELEEIDSANETRAAHFNRRAFIQGSTTIMTTVAVAGPLQSLMSRQARGDDGVIASPYGTPVPAADLETGLELLKLPPGFRYRSFGWTGDAMLDGNATPDKHDGMAVIGQYGPYAVLSRNHESGNGPAFAGGSIQYSPSAAGGCTTVLFNTWTGQFVTAFSALSGTIRNCAGGPTPWGTWLTCEETTGTSEDGAVRHGYIFDVGVFGSNAQPLRDMGRFSHEAVAVDPRTSQVYETEDAGDSSGFYCFTPRFPRFLGFGGKLQMAKVKGVDNFDFRTVPCDGREYEIEWVDIENPDPDLQGGEDSCFEQGYAKGAAQFRRLEGIWYGNGKYYIVSTNGGEDTPDSGSGEGIIFEYTPPRGFSGFPFGGEGRSRRRRRRRCGTLKVIYVSPAASVLENPDNIVVAPGGNGLLLCEDNSGGRFNDAERLIGLTLDGQAFTFAENNIDFSESGLGSYTRRGSGITFDGNEKQSEWAGATYSHNGEWMFVNIQTPGVTFAITGPWGAGPLGISRRGRFGRRGA
ncbi:MAG: PhoX family protein [Pirellulales bacterium]|nr:PhoX family protein [Pirellulales bacterium]